MTKPLFEKIITILPFVTLEKKQTKGTKIRIQWKELIDVVIISIILGATAGIIMVTELGKKQDAVLDSARATFVKTDILLKTMEGSSKNLNKIDSILLRLDNLESNQKKMLNGNGKR